MTELDASADSSPDIGRNAGILGLLRDGANAVTMAGLVAAILAIDAAVDHSYHRAAAFLLLAVWCDLVDGLVARRSRARPAYLAAAGGHLDSLADVVHGGVVPGIVVMVARGGDPLSVAAAVVLAVAVVARLAYFNLNGVSPDGRYTGLPVFYNSLGFGALPLLADAAALAAIGPAVALGLAALNVSSLRIPKQGRGTLAFLLALTAGLAFANLLRLAPTP
jgi:CDP-diacylglycerol--serine O-phosphatidyltransferase